VYKRQIYQIAESNRIEKIDLVARIESNRNFFCPNWNALVKSHCHTNERLCFFSLRVINRNFEHITRNMSVCVPHFEYTELTDNLIRTRGNKFKLVQHHCHYDFRKYNFTNRVIPIWNSLSNHVVSAETVNTFKNRLDKFWLD